MCLFSFVMYCSLLMRIVDGVDGEGVIVKEKHLK